MKDTLKVTVTQTVEYYCEVSRDDAIDILEEEAGGEMPLVHWNDLGDEDLAAAFEDVVTNGEAGFKVYELMEKYGEIIEEEWEVKL